MLIKRPPEGFGDKYNVITEEEGIHRDMMMDFGLIELHKGDFHRDDSGKERAFLLMNGSVSFSWNRSVGNPGKAVAERYSLLDEEPTVLHVPSGTEVRIDALEDDVELAVQGVANTKNFPVRLWKPGDYPCSEFGAGTLQDTSTRTVRTVFDASTAPESAMVMGEVINHPGKWSSYPPHDHAHPEIYHFRLFPRQGFGFSIQGDDGFIVHNGDTVTIPPGVVHPQAAAPGYAMYYIWLIPHLPNNRFGPDSRNFRKEHSWALSNKAPIWPDANLEAVLTYQIKEGNSNEDN